MSRLQKKVQLWVKIDKADFLKLILLNMIFSSLRSRHSAQSDKDNHKQNILLAVIMFKIFMDFRLSFMSCCERGYFC